MVCALIDRQVNMIVPSELIPRTPSIFSFYEIPFSRSDIELSVYRDISVTPRLGRMHSLRRSPHYGLDWGTVLPSACCLLPALLPTTG